MERLEAEKRLLQEKLDTSASQSPKIQTLDLLSSSSSGVSSLSQSSAASLNPSVSASGNLLIGLPPMVVASDQAANLTEHIINLRREVSRLKANLEKVERDHKENMAKIVREEKLIKEENVRLQRRLQMEVDRREALCRHLSESESSLEMDDERHFNESSRVRTISSPIPSYVIQNNATTANTIPNQMSTSVGTSNTTSNLVVTGTFIFVFVNSKI